jgi:ankyrin repeat protein
LGWTALFWAVNVECIDAFVEAGCDINFTAKCDGSKPIHPATHGNFQKVVEKYIDMGIDVDVMVDENDAYTRTPLQIACGKEVSSTVISMVEMLISRGANVNFAIEPFLFTPLHIVCGLQVQDKSNSEKIVEILLANGAEMEKNDFQGWNALHFASRDDRVEAVEMLLKNNNNNIVESTTNQNKTPLHIAVERGSDKVLSSAGFILFFFFCVC